MINKDGNTSKTKAEQDMTSNMCNSQSHDARLSDKEIENIADKLIDENIVALSELAK